MASKVFLAVMVGLVLVLLLRMFAARGGISGEEARRLVGEGALLLDVRTTSEFAAGHLPSAINIPVQELSGRVGELDRSRTIVVYCQSGARSARAKRLLEDQGFQSVSDLGAMRRW